MELKLSQSIDTFPLANLIAKTANDLDFKAIEHSSNKRTLDLSSMSYLYSHDLIIRPKSFFSKNILVYSYLCEDERIFPRKGVSLRVSGTLDDNLVISPTISSVSEIRNYNLRRFVVGFYEKFENYKNNS